MPKVQSKPLDPSLMNKKHVLFARGAHMPIVIYVGGSSMEARSDEAKLKTLLRESAATDKRLIEALKIATTYLHLANNKDKEHNF